MLLQGRVLAVFAWRVGWATEAHGTLCVKLARVKERMAFTASNLRLLWFMCAYNSQAWTAQEEHGFHGSYGSVVPNSLKILEG